MMRLFKALFWLTLGVTAGALMYHFNVFGAIGNWLSTLAH